MLKKLKFMNMKLLCRINIFKKLLKNVKFYDKILKVYNKTDKKAKYI